MVRPEGSGCQKGDGQEGERRSGEPVSVLLFLLQVG